MTDRITNDWEALLDGTTEGPWKWHWDKGLLAITGPNGEAIAIDAEVKDSDLIAAAPEAAAEVVRLRRELEELQRSCLSAASAYRGAAPTARFREVLEDRARELETVDRDLTRILEGGTDE